MSNNTMSEEELELNLIELFSKVISLGFGMRLTKEEFAEAVKNGAIDHQEAVHEAMRLVEQYTLSKQIEALLAIKKKIYENTNVFDTALALGLIDAQLVSMGWRPGQERKQQKELK